MKIDHRYVSVKKLTNHSGDGVCKILPAYQSITGCDTTSFPFRIGKVKPWKKMLKQEKCHLLSQLGRSDQSVQDVESTKTFFRTCMYSGTEQESFVGTRIRMYNSQKVKSSCSIIPDENSTKQHLKRSDLQAWLWNQCLRQNIEYPSITDRGWETTQDGIKPVWFTCPQLPPTLTKTKSRERRIQGLTDYEADEDDSTTEKRSHLRQKKKDRTTSRQSEDREVYCGKRKKPEGYIESAREADDLKEGGTSPTQRKIKTSNTESFTAITDRIKIHGDGAKETAEESGSDEEYEGDGERSETDDYMEECFTDNYRLDSDFEGEDSDIDLSD